MTSPHFSFEQSLHAHGTRRVAGVDEAGRGPLAGPVTAAAVRLDPGRIPKGLNDSKCLSAPQREALYVQLIEVAEISVAHASVAEIEELNILQASHLAMRRALAGLGAADFALIDGKYVPDGLGISARAIVRGDAHCLSIAAASIIAKVERDRLMTDLARAHPGYGWERNAGYPTPEHRRALKSLGATPHHRRTFRPVHQILCPDLTLTP